MSRMTECRASTVFVSTVLSLGWLAFCPGQAAALALLEPNPTVVTFGSQRVDVQSDPVVVSITNLDTVDSATSIVCALVNDGSFHNPDAFAVSACPSYLTVGASFTINVTFTPNTLGVLGAMIRIAYDDGSGSTYVDVPLRGWGFDGPDLVVNGDFDTSVAEWTELSIPLSWDPSDYQANPTSGSALILNNASLAANSGAIQCVDGIVGGQAYRLSAWLRVPTGQTGSGQTRVFVWWYSQPGCTGTWLEESSTPYITTSDTWNEVIAGSAAAPVTAQSAVVYLNCNKQTETGTYQAVFDHVVFQPLGGAIFADGFESGGVSAWSATVS